MAKRDLRIDDIRGASADGALMLLSYKKELAHPMVLYLQRNFDATRKCPNLEPGRGGYVF